LAGRHCLVSTIITTYERPQFVTRTLSNLLRQAYRPLEILVVDDGSSEATANAVLSWRDTHKPDPDFKLHYHWQKNQGPASARNTGIRASSGGLIHFLDDDDLLDADALAHLAAALDPTEAAIGMASYRNWPCGGLLDPIKHPVSMSRHRRLRAMLAGRWFVPLHGYLFTRPALDLIGPWNPALTSQEDDEFLLRAALADVTFKCVPKARVYYCHHHGFRRSVPGKPGETATQGTISRMYDDLHIRETLFATLKKGGNINDYRASFWLWQQRFQQRYAQLKRDPRLSSDFLNWLKSLGEHRSSRALLLRRRQSFVSDEPQSPTWRTA